MCTCALTCSQVGMFACTWTHGHTHTHACMHAWCEHAPACTLAANTTPLQHSARQYDAQMQHTCAAMSPTSVRSLSTMPHRHTSPLALDTTGASRSSHCRSSGAKYLPPQTTCVCGHRVPPSTRPPACTPAHTHAHVCAETKRHTDSCAHARTRLCKDAHARTHARTHAHACTSTHTRKHMRARTNARTHTCTHVCVRKGMRVCVCTPAHTRTDTQQTRLYRDCQSRWPTVVPGLGADGLQLYRGCQSTDGGVSPLL